MRRLHASIGENATTIRPSGEKVGSDQSARLYVTQPNYGGPQWLLFLGPGGAVAEFLANVWYNGYDSRITAAPKG